MFRYEGGLPNSLYIEVRLSQGWLVHVVVFRRGSCCLSRHNNDSYIVYAYYRCGTGDTIAVPVCWTSAPT